MALDKRRILSFLRYALLAFGFILSVSAVSEIFVIIGLSSIFIFVIFFPVIEEAFKLFFAIKARHAVFSIIVIFAVVEAIIVKIPLLYRLSYNELWIGFSFVLFSFIFHLSTAYVYNGNLLRGRVIFLFFPMVALHSIFNSLELFNFSIFLLILFSAVLSIAPYVWLRLFQRIIRARR